MKTIHIIAGHENSKVLSHHIAQHQIENESVFTIQDELDIGPLKTQDMSFSEGRTAFWKDISNDHKKEFTINDLERLMEISTRISNGEEINIWFWMSHDAAEICTYFWLLHFLKKHQGKLFVINIAGLPFINEEGSLFFPQKFSELPDKEILKAKKLVRPIHTFEWETDIDTWKILLTENSFLRTIKSNKQVSSQSPFIFDKTLKELFQEIGNKPNRIINQAISKHGIKSNKYFLEWRLREIMSVEQEVEN